jgi:hypothetical protein
MVDQAFNLRAGDAGPEVTGTPGNVLTFQADGKVRGEAPAGGGAPLTAVWFVDASAAPGGDGSLGAPFATFADAITAAQADFALVARDQSIVLTPVSYEGEALQTLTLDGTHWLRLSTWGTGLENDTVPFRPRLPQLAMPAGNLIGDGVVWQGVTTPQVDVPAGTCSFNGCSVHDVNAVRVFAGFSYVGGGNISVVLDAYSSSLGSLTATLARIRSTRALGPTNIFGDLELDEYSNAGQLFTASGTVRIIGRPAQEQVQLVVPAILAGQVGYADATFVGELAAITADSPLTCNPTRDIVAAGAGGGLINCRVSATGTARCAFVGPLAGGAEYIVFSAP